MESLGMIQESKVVVGLDFGTTFSGFAYALRACPDRIYTFYEWPMQAHAGATPYCKTQTSLLYAHASPGSFQLLEWGWPAYVTYKASNASASDSGSNSLVKQFSDAVSLPGGSKQPAASEPSHGSKSSSALQFLTLFKLHLGTPAAASSASHRNPEPGLPPGMTARRAITDYLAQISKFVLQEVRNKFGYHISLDDIEWCLTVPAIWDEHAKREMRSCAEMACLVQGASSTKTGSPHLLKIFIEPEAASAYCQKKLTEHKWKKGEKFLVVDCGGGTVDLVLHEKLGSAPSVSVREIQESSGDLCGGSRVDEEFFRFMKQKISCFNIFKRKHPAIVLKFRQSWEKVKFAFDGESKRDVQVDLPTELATMWENHLATSEMRRASIASWSFDELVISYDDMRSIFDPVVDRILELIEGRMVSNLQAIMVVGGFAASPYLMRRITDTFESRVSTIMRPPHPGRAVCCGAVTLGILSDTVVSRISKKAWGIRTAIRFDHDLHPVSSMIENGHGRTYCGDGFLRFVRKGDEVLVDDCVRHSLSPLRETQTGVAVDLYSSDREDVQYVTDPGMRKEGTFSMKCPTYQQLGFKPTVEISMFFGRTEIQVTAIGSNFASEKKGMLPVKFERDSIY